MAMGSFKHGNEHVGSIDKRWVISWQSDCYILKQEGLCSMELDVTKLNKWYFK
jgi:hypothetical protein